MQKFKIGDRVRFKSWARMAKEYRVQDDGDIKIKDVFFTRDMKHLCNTFATVRGTQVGPERILLSDFTAGGDTDWSYSPEMLVRARDRKKKELPLGLEYEEDDKQKEEPKTDGKLKAGDRVKAIRPVGNSNKIGVCGTVIGIDGCTLPYLVEFDEYIDGHGGHIPFTGKGGYCWWCNESNIELIDQPKKKRGRPVGSKNKKKVELDKCTKSTLYTKDLGGSIYLDKEKLAEIHEETQSKEDKIVSLLEQILEEIKGLKHTEVKEEKKNPLVSILDDVLDKIRKDEKASSEKFSVGDRVTPREGRDNSGIKGTIIGFFDGFFSRCATVEFDKKIPRGHNGRNCETKGKDGYCWNYSLSDIELIKKGGNQE